VRGGSLGDLVALLGLPLLALAAVVGFTLSRTDSPEMAIPVLLALVAVAATSARRLPGILTAIIAAVGFPAGWHDSDARIPVAVAVAAGAIAFSVRVLGDRAARLAGRLEVANERLRRLALRDTLTGLLDRPGFDSALRAELSREGRHAGSFAVLAVDLDRLKRLNIRMGRSVGDTVIQLLAESLERNIRESDTAARVDGDEFAVILPETDTTGARVVAQRITADFEESVARTLSGRPKISTAFGVAVYPSDGRESDDLLAVADERIAAMRRRAGASVGAT
jgi:diguanylate cyclase (GGDEF)-like protein